MGHDQDRHGALDAARRAAAHRARLERLLDATPFGEALARRLWHRLLACPEGEGLVHQFHRDHCGHGLMRTAAGVKLCDIQDGRDAGPALAEWTEEAAFVAFWARQSDRTCSGLDAGEPVLAARSDWDLGNQRLTGEILRRFA